MENFYNHNNALYPKPTDMNRCIQLMNTQMGSPFSIKSGCCYNPKLLMNSPYESYRCDNAENIDPQILMSLSSGSSSSGDNFSSPSGSSRIRYRGGYDRSPLSLVESSGNSSCASATKSPSVFVKTPLNMEDDVLVMDEVFVVNALGGRSRSGKDSSGSSASSVQSYKMDVGKDSRGSSASSVHSYKMDVGKDSRVSSASSVQGHKMDVGKDSSGSSASSVQGLKMDVGKDSSGSSESSVHGHKMDVCSLWAETGSCRFGSSCQFSHMKEAPSLARLLTMGKPELEICFPRSPFSNSSLSSFKGHNSRPAMSCGEVHGRSSQGAGTIGNYRGSPAGGSGSGFGDSRRSTAAQDSLAYLDWMPQDDGINAWPPVSDNPSRYEVLACINNYLYGPRVRKRLPVFTSFCPDDPPAAEVSAHISH